jgi:hypothetical protein
LRHPCTLALTLAATLTLATSLALPLALTATLALPLALASATLTLMIGGKQVVCRKIERAVALIRIISGHPDRPDQYYNQRCYHYSLNHYSSPFGQMSSSDSKVGSDFLKL